MMKPLHHGSAREGMAAVARLAREATEQEGEDNVRPWLRVHQTLIQAALRGYKVGVPEAVERARRHTN